MRDSSSAGLGSLPEGWSVVRFGDLFEIQQGKALSPKAREGNSPHPFLRTANVLWGRLDLGVVDRMDFSPAELLRYELRPGDLLILEGGEIGRAAVWDGQIPGCCYQNHIHRCRPKDERAVPTFYVLWMRYAMLVRRLYEGHGNKTTIPNLSKSRLAAFEVALPPVDQQLAIATTLGAVESAKLATRQREAALDGLFDALLNGLLSGQVLAIPSRT